MNLPGSNLSRWANYPNKAFDDLHQFLHANDRIAAQIFHGNFLPNQKEKSSFTIYPHIKATKNWCEIFSVS